MQTRSCAARHPAGMRSASDHLGDSRPSAVRPCHLRRVVSGHQQPGPRWPDAWSPSLQSQEKLTHMRLSLLPSPPPSPSLSPPPSPPSFSPLPPRRLANTLQEVLQPGGMSPSSSRASAPVEDDTTAFTNPDVTMDHQPNAGRLPRQSAGTRHEFLTMIVVARPPDHRAIDTSTDKDIMAGEIASSIEMLRKLVAFDTTSRYSNLALIEYVQAYLRGHGVESKLVPNEDGSKANSSPPSARTLVGGVVPVGPHRRRAGRRPALGHRPVDADA